LTFDLVIHDEFYNFAHKGPIKAGIADLHDDDEASGSPCGRRSPLDLRRCATNARSAVRQSRSSPTSMGRGDICESCARAAIEKLNHAPALAELKMLRRCKAIR
jgi:hypothetical protein